MKKPIAISLLLTVISINSVFAGEIDWENYAGPEEFAGIMQKVLQK